MAREGMTREIVELRYPLYDSEMRALISKIYAAYRDQPDVDERLIDAIWNRGHAEFRRRNVEASRSDAESLAQAEQGNLTAAGRVAIIAYLDAAQDLDDALRHLSDAEFVTRYDDVCGSAEILRQARRIERGHQADILAFFNQKKASADFPHWLGLSVWSPEEAVALSFGKNPRLVNVDTLREYKHLHGSPFRDQYMARLDKIDRALRSRELREPLLPKRFLKWAMNEGIKLPPELAVGIRADRDSRSDLHIRKVHTLYKVLLGLAITHYNYDPTLDDDDEQIGVFKPMANALGAVDAKTSVPTLRDTFRRARAWAIIEPQPLVKRAKRLKDAKKQTAGRKI